jgi:hypothetical protein
MISNHHRIFLNILKPGTSQRETVSDRRCFCRFDAVTNDLKMKKHKQNAKNKTKQTTESTQ